MHQYYSRTNLLCQSSPAGRSALPKHSPVLSAALQSTHLISWPPWPELPLPFPDLLTFPDVAKLFWCFCCFWKLFKFKFPNMGWGIAEHHVQLTGAEAGVPSESLQGWQLVCLQPLSLSSGRLAAECFSWSQLAKHPGLL